MLPSRTLRFVACAMLLVALCGCGGQDHLTQPGIDQLTPQVFTLDVEQPQSVYVSCIADIQCRITWRSGDFFNSPSAIIYRNTVDSFATAAEIGREDFFTSYTDRNVESGTRYYYWVVFEENGELGAPSDSVSACARGLFPVVACAAPTGTPGEGEPNTETPTADMRELSFPRKVSNLHYQTLKQSLLSTDVGQAPVYHDGEHLFVGVDQGVDILDSMKAAGSSQVSSTEIITTPAGTYQTSINRTTKTTIQQRGDWTIRHARLSETRGRGGSSELLAEYLKQSAQVQRTDGTPVVLRFKAPPEVRFGGAAATAEDTQRLMRAVQLVNTALPLEWRMEMPHGVPLPLPDEDERDGIHVEFVSEADYDRSSADSLGYAMTAWLPDGSIPHATVTINEAYRADGEQQAVAVLAHELIHALGIGHVSSRLATIMAADLDLAHPEMPLSILYPIDRQALRALYGRLDAGDAYNSFGVWNDTQTHLVGNGDHASFGVALRNGYAEPWAHGLLAESDLADNPSLAGTAAWTGFLLGFTPEAAPVAGNARLGVKLDDLTGNAIFTSLESWAVGEVPGSAGTGTKWGRGSLFYTIAVTGNTFQQTGSDEGFLTGAFFGESHEGMGGTLERDDLTAAFGGER